MRIRAALLFLIPGIAACAAGGAYEGPEDFVEPLATAEHAVDVAMEGGEVRASESGVVLEVPPLSMAQATTITLSEELYAAGLVLDLGPDGTTFEPAAYLVVDTLMFEQTAADVWVLHRLEDGGWTPLQERTTDQRGAVTFRIEHFSKYAISQSSTNE